MPRRSRLINAPLRAAFGRRFATAKQALALQTLQCRVDLAEFGGPKIMDALAENCFQIVTAGGLTEQAEQDVFQAHEATI
jgi:hypothetical protein